MSMVYSTETGRVPQDKNAAKAATLPVHAPVDGTVRLQRQTKGRGGGTVIVITGIPLTAEALKEIAGVLKKRCGCGGTVKNGVIEIQGDHRNLLLDELQSRGYRVKLSGG